MSLTVKITGMRWKGDDAVKTEEALKELVESIQAGCLEGVDSLYWEIPYSEKITEKAAEAEKKVERALSV